MSAIAATLSHFRPALDSVRQTATSTLAQTAHRDKIGHTVLRVFQYLPSTLKYGTVFASTLVGLKWIKDHTKDWKNDGNRAHEFTYNLGLSLFKGMMIVPHALSSPIPFATGLFIGGFCAKKWSKERFKELEKDFNNCTYKTVAGIGFIWALTYPVSTPVLTSLIAGTYTAVWIFSDSGDSAPSEQQQNQAQQEAQRVLHIHVHHHFPGGVPWQQTPPQAEPV